MEHVIRCKWVEGKNPDYVAYHDREWGRPLHNEGKLYEMFLLELFQAGLSWSTLLAKRDNFRAAFDDFDPVKVASYTQADIERLMQDKGIVRNRLKVEASITNAQAFLAIEEEKGSFDTYLWDFVDGRAVEVPYNVTQNDLSCTVSADLKQRGVRFAGPVTIHSLLQATGVINSHSHDCFVYHELKS